jgi:hypothetical protein
MATLKIIVADTNHLFQVMRGTVEIDQIQIAGQPFTYILVGMGAYLLRRRGNSSAIVADGQHLPEQSLWRVLVPYAPVPPVIGLAAYVWDVHAPEQLLAGVLGACGALVGLTFFRQVLTILENRRLYTRLDAAYQETSATRLELERSNQALLQANAHLEALSTTDPLTSLLNHRAIDVALTKELERARRFHRPGSLIFLDLDHVKALNDNYGHLAGDAALGEFGEVVARALRGVDTLGRWGGEEFVAILPEAEPSARATPWRVGPIGREPDI